jgi:hypothetical protein
VTRALRLTPARRAPLSAFATTVAVSVVPASAVAPAGAVLTARVSRIVSEPLSPQASSAKEAITESVATR